PSSPSRRTKASVHRLWTAGVFAPKKPMVGSLPGCCALAANGHAAAPPPSSVMNSRRFIPNIGHPPSASARRGTGQRTGPTARAVGLPRHEPTMGLGGGVLGADLNCSELRGPTARAGYQITAQ